MQLLDSPSIQALKDVNERLADVLTDIIHNVEIKPDFSIRHPDYKPFELPVEVVSCFQQLPQPMQNKYLSLQLRSFLYGIYYNGSMQTTLASDSETDNLAIDLENNTFLGVDLAFYQQLHQSNQGKGYFDQGWLVLKQENDGGFTVTKGGLKLYIEPEKHLQDSEKSAVVGNSVAIRMPKNLVQNGFYVAVGNEGLSRVESSNNPPVTVRIYFNLTPEGAVRVMENLTRQLNELAIPFHFKVLYNPNDYERYDSGVLYFDENDYEKVREVLLDIHHENESYFKSEIPLFTMQIAPGLGLAEEPDHKFGEQESFGMNRCQILANGLLNALQNGDNSTDSRIKAIFEEFNRLGIDLQYTYLNANSENIYEL